MGAKTRRAFLACALGALTVVVPIPASAGGGGCAELTEGRGTTVEILYSCITPTLIRVDEGATVTFVNRDSYRHDIAGAGYGWSSEGFLGAGDAFTATFRRDGIYPFMCYLHPGMTGAVVVGSGTGLGPATSGNVLVEQVSLEQPIPELVYVTRPPEIRTVVARSSSAGAWTAGIVVGLATGLLVGAGAWFVARRRIRGAST
jgi:plastocyanin